MITKLEFLFREAPLTELNAEWCRSEGVGSMWVGSLRT